MTIYQITGRITKKEGKTGVHGLLIKVLDKDRQFDDLLGSVLTDQEGRFALVYDEDEAPVLFAKRPSFALRVYDRDEVALHTTRKVTRFQPGKTAHFDIRLADEVLAKHLDRPVSMKRLSGRILDRQKLDAIQQALHFLAQPGTQEYTRLMSLSLCPLPPIDRFENLLDDAWLVLDGDWQAQQRFGDVLELLGKMSAAREPGMQRRVDEKDLDKILDGLGKRIDQLSPIEAVLGAEAMMPVLLAAAVAAGPNPQRLNHYLEIAIDQLAAYRPLTLLFGAAQGAQRGGQNDIAYFGAMLRMFEGWCGPDDGPFPGWPIPWPREPEIPPQPEILEHWHCTALAYFAIRRIRERLGFPPRGMAPPYTIDSIMPSEGCAGARITLTGTNFGSTTAVVRFTSTSGTPIDVAPLTWTPTEITVQVPEDVGYGPVSLRIPDQSLTVEVCNAFVDIHTFTPGTPATFMGGPPDIISFLVNGATSLTPRPGTPLTLTWNVRNADTIRVRRLSGEGPGVDTTDPAGTSLDLGVISRLDADTVYGLSATNECGTTEATVIVRPACVLRATMSSEGLSPGFTVSSDSPPGTPPLMRTLAATDRFILRATGTDACGVRNIWISGEIVVNCIRVADDLGRRAFMSILAENRDTGVPGDTGLPSRSVEMEIDVQRWINSCASADMEFENAGGFLTATAENLDGDRVSTVTFSFGHP